MATYPTPINFIISQLIDYLSHHPTHQYYTLNKISVN